MSGSKDDLPILTPNLTLFGRSLYSPGLTSLPAMEEKVGVFGKRRVLLGNTMAVLSNRPTERHWPGNLTDKHKTPASESTGEPQLSSNTPHSDLLWFRKAAPNRSRTDGWCYRHTAFTAKQFESPLCVLSIKERKPACYLHKHSGKTVRNTAATGLWIHRSNGKSSLQTLRHQSEGQSESPRPSS